MAVRGGLGASDVRRARRLGVTPVKYVCICTPKHCYGDIFEHPVHDVCLHCHHDWRAFEQCSANVEPYRQED